MDLKTTKFPAVSVIIPVYNVEAYLAECLRSVQDQTFGNFEVIAINDGSTDESPLILQKFAEKDSRFKVIEQKNAGQSAARNAGMKAASGKYIFFLDSDDFIAPDALEKVVSLADAKGADIVVYDYYLFDAQTGKTGFYRDQKLFSQLNGLTFKIQQSPQLLQFVGVWDRLFRREFLEAHNFQFPEGRLYEDHLFCVETELKAEKIALTDNHIYYWRQNVKGSTTNIEKGSKKHREDYIFIQRAIQEELKNADATNEMLSYYAAYFLEFAYMHLRWVKGKQDFFDYFNELRMLSSSKLMHLASHINDPRILYLKKSLKNNKPAYAYVFMKTTNQLQSLVKAIVGRTKDV